MRISDWSSDVCSSDLERSIRRQVSGKDVQGQDRPCKGGAARSANSCGSGKYLCVRGAAFGGDRAGTGQGRERHSGEGAFHRQIQEGPSESQLRGGIDLGVYDSAGWAVGFFFERFEGNRTQIKRK